MRSGRFLCLVLSVLLSPVFLPLSPAEAAPHRNGFPASTSRPEPLMPDLPDVQGPEAGERRMTAYSADRGESAADMVPADPSRRRPPFVRWSGVLDAVAVEESGNQAFVSLSTNGLTDYSVMTLTKLSRKWISIELPAVVPDLPVRLDGGKRIIGEVDAEQHPSGKGIRILVEILPVRVVYEIYQEGGSLILKVTGQ